MDVLRPSLLWINGRCYRMQVLESPRETTTAELEEEEETDEDVEATDLLGRSAQRWTDCITHWLDEPCNLDFEVNETASGDLKTFMQIPQPYYGTIVGSKGLTRKRLENETSTHIIIPRLGEDGQVVIFGKTRRSLSSARTRIEVIVNAARQREAFTHFLSIPLTDSAIKEAFIEFRSDVLRECYGVRGICPSIFQTPEKLHLTFGTMPLLDENERHRASELLAECCEQLVYPILDGQPLVINIKGLEYMNDDPEEVDVLYAVVEMADDSDKLQMLADQLVDRFVKEGVMHRQYERVKLHVTILNTRFRQSPCDTGELHSRRSKLTERESFNASPILKRFERHNFGQMRASELHLSLRYSHNSKDGYYSCTAKQELP